MLGDEPFYARFRSQRYVDDRLGAYGGGTSGATAFLWSDDEELTRRYLRVADPAQLIVDIYPFTGRGVSGGPSLPAAECRSGGIPAYDRGTYLSATRSALNQVALQLSIARRTSQEHGIDFWHVPQTHGATDSLIDYSYRPLLGPEISAQVYMGLAYGARGIFYYLYHTIGTAKGNVGLVARSGSHASNCDAALNGLWTGYRDRWDAVRALNQEMKQLTPTLLALQSEGVYYSGDATPFPSGCVGAIRENGNPAEDVHVGAFVHNTTGLHYILVVNRNTVDARSIEIELRDAPGYERRMVDVGIGQSVATLAPGVNTFPISIGPGKGRLFAIQETLVLENVVFTSSHSFSAPSIMVRDVNLWSGASVTLSAYDSITFGPGFTAELGSSLRAEIVANPYVPVTSSLVRAPAAVRVNDADASGSIAEAAQTEEAMPVQFAVFQNYPNPFNVTTTIRIALPEQSHVTLVIYNVSGQAVAELVDEGLAAGLHEVSFDARNLPSGLYFYRIEAGLYREIRRMMLVK